jgi:hypothetical protein
MQYFLFIYRLNIAQYQSSDNIKFNLFDFCSLIMFYNIKEDVLCTYLMQSAGLNYAKNK